MLIVSLSSVISSSNLMQR